MKEVEDKNQFTEFKDKLSNSYASFVPSSLIIR